jgi:DnaK suppressor protein
MEKKKINSLKRELLSQRDRLFRELAGDEEGLRFVAEDREGELEERAQEDRIALLLSRLSDREKREIEAIDAALERIAEGIYGRCQSCRRTIPMRRLRVLPATRFCVNCISQEEKEMYKVGAEEAPAGEPVAGDASLLPDRELQELIRDRVKEDGRIDMDELKIVCRHGVTYLSGAVPSEAERSILLQLLTDVIAVKDVVDHLQVNELLWEREDRSKQEPPEQSLPWIEPAGTEDVVENAEEGTDYVAPAVPIPEKE